MKRLIYLALNIVFGICLLVGCNYENQSTVSSTPVDTESAVDDTPVQIPLLDYVEIHRNKDLYDGQTVSVVGRINDISTRDYCIYLNERLGTNDDGLGFKIELDKLHYRSESLDSYKRGTYIVVEGTYHSGTYASLRDAIITDSGNTAKRISDSFTDVWIAQREEMSNNTPITDFVSIYDNPTQYLGTYVRIVGKVASPGTNQATNHTYFRFRSETDSMKSISIILKGCPQEMQNLCTEGTYAIISGLVEGSFSSVKLTDCYVECTGSQAEELYNSISIPTKETPDSDSTSSNSSSKDTSPSRSLVGSINSDKYHWPSCRWAKKIELENEIWFSDAEEAKAAGYSPCGTCH